MCQKVYHALGSKCRAKQPQLPFRSLHMDRFPKVGGLHLLDVGGMHPPGVGGIGECFQMLRVKD